LRKDVIFVLVGGGDEAENLRAKAESYGMTGDNFRFAGFLSHETALEFRRQADVNLVLMGGYSLIEACASGKPVIAYDVEWHYELIKDGETGFLVKENDVNTVAQKIDLLLSDDKLSKKLGEAARRLAFSRHSGEIASCRKVEVYKEILGMKS